MIAARRAQLVLLLLAVATCFRAAVATGSTAVPPSTAIQPLFGECAAHFAAGMYSDVHALHRCLCIWLHTEPCCHGLGCTGVHARCHRGQLLLVLLLLLLCVLCSTYPSLHNLLLQLADGSIACTACAGRQPTSDILVCNPPSPQYMNQPDRH
jgi:hypothetical protein